MKTSWQNNISLFKLAINDGIENCICMHQQHTHTKHVNNLQQAIYYIGCHIPYMTIRQLLCMIRLKLVRNFLFHLLNNLY